MTNILKILPLLFMFALFPAKAQDIAQPTKTTEDIMNQYASIGQTPCATKIFADALVEHSDEISEDEEETVVQSWAKNTMHNPDILRRVLTECDEIKNANPEKTIIFTPIVYKFPLGRTLTINYRTQPKVLEQILLLSTKPSLPTDEISPQLMDPNDPAKWINTEPAWYAIMVVQHDSLSDFVGPEKNNIVSIQYINDNIKQIYPHGYHCTSRSAWANDSDTINKTVREVVQLEKDSNDYYVAGDINLEWVMYAEIAADVIITIVTAGGGAFLSGALKGARATKAAKNLITTLKGLTKLDDVKDYLKVTRQIAQHSDDIAKLGKNIELAEKYEETIRKAEKLREAGMDAMKYYDEAEQILEAARKIDPKLAKNVVEMTRPQTKALADIEKNIARYEKQIAELKGKNPSKAKELRAKIANQKYEREKILNQVGTKDLTDITKFDATKLREEQKALQQTLKTLENDARNMEKASQNVATYKKQAEALEELMKLRRQMRALSRPQTGNIIARTIRSFRAYGNSAKTLRQTSRVARAGLSSRSAKVSDWLFQTTLKHGSRLAKFESQVGLLYGVISFLGDMYDKTSETSKEFSNGIEFKPLCLLSADDLEGQENVVNYGMWFMWVGNSTDPADDDAAYLQSMDFAAKFAYKLTEYQKEHGAECNVDIYVVRPIIRLDETNKDDPKGQMFYLFMNEIPWTTAAQFSEQIKDVKEWERTQANLEENDPNNKYKKTESEQTAPTEQQPENKMTLDNIWRKSGLQFVHEKLIINT